METPAESGLALQSETKNPRGIPHAPFIIDVGKYVGRSDAEVEPVLIRLQEALAKYRYMEASLTQRKSAVESKIPDVKKTLAMVKFLQERQRGKNKKAATEHGAEDDHDLENDGSDEDNSDLEDDNGYLEKPLRTTFELNDTLYAEAELEDTDTVYLWLGADVMLSYKIPEAIELLESKLKIAEENLATHITDLEYVKEQITIMEVNTARVFNWDVKRRRLQREREAAGGQKS